MKAFIKPFEAAQTGLTSEEKSDDTEVQDKTKQKVKTASNKSVNVKRQIPDKKESMEQPVNDVYFIKKNQYTTFEK